MLNTVIEGCVQNKCCHMLGYLRGGACHKVVSKILKKIARKYIILVNINIFKSHLFIHINSLHVNLSKLNFRTSIILT